jgi:hypothetical protein
MLRISVEKGSGVVKDTRLSLEFNSNNLYHKGNIKIQRGVYSQESILKKTLGLPSFACQTEQKML